MNFKLIDKMVELDVTADRKQLLEHSPANKKRKKGTLSTWNQINSVNDVINNGLLSDTYEVRKLLLTASVSDRQTKEWRVKWYESQEHETELRQFPSKKQHTSGQRVHPWTNRCSNALILAWRDHLYKDIQIDTKALEMADEFVISQQLFSRKVVIRRDLMVKLQAWVERLRSQGWQPRRPTGQHLSDQVKSTEDEGTILLDRKIIDMENSVGNKETEDPKSWAVADQAFAAVKLPAEKGVEPVKDKVESRAIHLRCLANERALDAKSGAIKWNGQLQELLGRLADADALAARTPRKPSHEAVDPVVRNIFTLNKKTRIQKHH